MDKLQIQEEEQIRRLNVAERLRAEPNLMDTLTRISARQDKKGNHERKVRRESSRIKEAVATTQKKKTVIHPMQTINYSVHPAKLPISIQPAKLPIAIQPTNTPIHLPRTLSKRDALTEFLREQYPRCSQHVQMNSIDESWSTDPHAEKSTRVIKSISVLMKDMLRVLSKNDAGIAKIVLNKLCTDFMKDIENTDEAYYTKRINVGRPKQTKAAVCLNSETQSRIVDVNLDSHNNTFHKPQNSETVVTSCDPAKKVDIDSVNKAVNDQTSSTFYEPQCICGMRTSVSESIVSNIRAFLEPLKANRTDHFASNARDAIITACTFGMSSKMNEVRKILGLNNRSFYTVKKRPNVRLNDYKPPTRKKRKSKHGDVQKDCVLEFCHPDDESSTDMTYRQSIIMKNKKHHLPVWSEKSVNQQYQMFISSETVDRYKALQPNFVVPSRSFYYHHRCQCLSHPMIEKPENDLAHPASEDAIENNSVNSEDIINLPMLM